MFPPSHLIEGKDRFLSPSGPRFRDWEFPTGSSRGVRHVEASLHNVRPYGGRHPACRSAERSLLANGARLSCHSGLPLAAWTLLGHFCCSNLFLFVPNSTSQSYRFTR